MKKPTKAVDACEEFFLIVVEAHVLSAAMALFGMSSSDSAIGIAFHLGQRGCLHLNESISC